jgi:uncharacterized protein with ParB-like and HNH nuclease domain
MKPSVKTLGEILYAPSQYVIPVFQRNYRWEITQWTKFWDSLEEIQRPDKRGNHFMGFLVFVPGLAQPGQHTTFHLIDGQQRLTTSSILLTAIRNIARQAKDGELADEIHDDYLVHPRKSADHHYRVLPKERDHDSYIAIITRSGKATGRVADALAHFEERLTPIAAEAPERLRQIFNVMSQRLEFMCATLEAENAYNIFKSLNSTGIPLGPADLIRNFVFMHVLPDDHDQFDRDLWGPFEDRFAKADGTLDEDRFSRFFRDFLMSDGRYIAPKDTFAEFEARYEATGFSPKELAAQLSANATYYEVISGRRPDKHEHITAALAGLNLLESSTTYPLMLSLFQKRAAGKITDADLAHAIEMLRGFILRRFICGESSRGYGQMFVRALAKDEGVPLTTLNAYLLERGWPDDQRFQNSFVQFPLYQRGYTSEVLETLERSRGHKEPADLTATQVEHVMPQTLSEEWRQALGSEAERIHADCLHRPGNLTLSAYNQELWNHPFGTKRQRYAQSNIVLTRELAYFDIWGEAEIDKRGRQLAAEAARIWTGPKEAAPAQPPHEEDEEESIGRREIRMQFWTGLNEFLAAEYPALQQVDTRPNWTIRLSSGLRHVGFELRFNLKHDIVGIDVWFWRAASRPVWERIKVAPAEYDALIEETWKFEPVEGRERARMFIDRQVSDLRSDATWPELYRWLGAKLTILYENVAPKLRQELDQTDTSPTMI